MPDDDWRGSQKARIVRRRALQDRIFNWSWVFRLSFCVAGYAWMLLLPTNLFVRKVWVDENALQPNSVKTHWDWPNVHQADYYLETMEAMKDRNASRAEYTSFIQEELRKMGLPSSTQSYKIRGPAEFRSGNNIYALLSAPRATAAEAIIVSASWESVSFTDASPAVRKTNFRAISLVLAIAKQYKSHSYWAKDIIFVFSDGYLDGMHAFLSSYHGADTNPNLRMDALVSIPRGVIWAAICLDYPGHSFSELGVFYEGANGRLPNQDLINSISVISRYTGNVPIVLYDQHPDELRARISGSLPDSWRSPAVAEYGVRALHIFRHMGYQASGRPSGVHGLFHQYRIDAITLFAVPAQGPHGFHALGKIMESTLRTVNNLLERLHASFFFYLLTSPDEFIVIGKYLTSAVLVGISLELNGLHGWVASGWQEFNSMAESGKRVPRPIVPVLIIMMATHIFGALFGASMTTSPVSRALESSTSFAILAGVLWMVPIAIAYLVARTDLDAKRVQPVLSSLTLCIAGTVVCVVSVLNFSLAAVLALAFGFALPFKARQHYTGLASKLLHYSLISLTTPTGIATITSFVFGWEVVHGFIVQVVWNWNALRVWTLPFISCVYLPLILQAGVAALLA